MRLISFVHRAYVCFAVISWNLSARVYIGLKPSVYTCSGNQSEADFRSVKIYKLNSLPQVPMMDCMYYYGKCSCGWGSDTVIANDYMFSACPISSSEILMFLLSSEPA